MDTQTPFVTVFLELDPEDEYLEYTALIIEEILKQRIQGVKNEIGMWITPVFPKLVYVLDEHNALKGGKYDYLTRLASECTSKRFYPDYISAKIMRETYEGNVFSPMGCVDGQEVVTYKFKNIMYVESFERMWNMFIQLFNVKKQLNEVDEYIDLSDVEIYDTKKGFVECKRLIRNTQDKWIDVNFKGGRRLLVTEDHPFDTENRGVVQAKDLKQSDYITVNYKHCSNNKNHYNLDIAWLLGFILCDGCYQGNKVSSSIALHGEDEIEQKYVRIFKQIFGIDTKIVIHKRGLKGDYKDLNLIGENDGKINKLINLFTSKFQGINKKDRMIPNEVFSWHDEEKYAFIGGMMDADGYVNDCVHGGGSLGQIGSTNKELALQQMMLLQSLGIKSKIYHNHYSSSNKSLIRHRVEFPTKETIIDDIVCRKKRKKYKPRETNYSETCDVNIESLNLVTKRQYAYDVETSSSHFEVSGVYSHNCRSFLSPYKNENGEYIFEGRFNQGVISLNLPQVALEVTKGGTQKADKEQFMDELKKRLDICFDALMYRHNALLGTTSDISPIHWQHGAIARLGKGEVIDEYLNSPYSTLSLGFIGVYECTLLMTGEPHTTLKGHEFAIEVMNYLKDKVDYWKTKTGLGFALYSTPSEGLCFRFAKIDEKKYGIIKDITDKEYYTNSYHVDVREEIDAFTKLKFESEFQRISTGGCISYIEVPNLQNNVEAIQEVIKFIYENVQYGEFNMKTDCCHECQYEGEILLDDNNEWYCPNCGNRDTVKMNIVRRTCGLTKT